MLYDDHTITINDVCDAVNFKAGKSDANVAFTSDHFLHACNEFYVHLSLILNAMFLHMHASNQANRSIALSSILLKILDIIVILKHNHALHTKDLWFGFKAGHSTMQCSFVLNDFADYHVRNNTPVLDASKATNCIHYVKLFRLLSERKMCRAIAKFLHVNYTHQTLAVRWQNAISVPFPCENDIKQGGVLAPVPFCEKNGQVVGKARIIRGWVPCWSSVRGCNQLC